MAFILYIYTKYTIGKIPIYKKDVLYFYIGEPVWGKDKKEKGKISYIYIREYKHNLRKIQKFPIYRGIAINIGKTKKRN